MIKMILHASNSLINIGTGAVLISSLLLSAGCTIPPCEFEPTILYTPTQRQIEQLPSPFEKLTREDLQYEWGKELYIGLNFANELDFYRAITSFKRALIMLPKSKTDRRMQIEYNIVLSYYLGQKYQEALSYYCSSQLDQATPEFLAYRELLILLYDCYQQTGKEEKAESIRELLEEIDAETAEKLELSEAFIEGDLACISELRDSESEDDSIHDFLNNYHAKALSVNKARTLNAVLPGAGYYYVGQKNAAVTSFIINGLFTWAAYAFFKNGYYAAGAITVSLESGWYIGGINGAGLAANEYNTRLYETGAKETMVKNCLFPVLMLQKSF
jgi:tetratricopeptide (TPR) repeat protein